MPVWVSPDIFEGLGIREFNIIRTDLQHLGMINFTNQLALRFNRGKPKVFTPFCWVSFLNPTYNAGLINWLWASTEGNPRFSHLFVGFRSSTQPTTLKSSHSKCFTPAISSHYFSVNVQTPCQSFGLPDSINCLTRSKYNKAVLSSGFVSNMRSRYSLAPGKSPSR